MADPRAPKARRSGGRPRPAVRADAPRSAALEVLRGVREGDSYANLLLPSVLRRHGLTGRDAGFTTELVAGTLRNQGTYDAVLAACVDRSLSAVDADVLDVLRLGAHQLLAMRVASHAAVATSVDLTRSVAGRGPSGFVNAVLRRVARQPLPDWVRLVAPDPVTDPRGFAAVAFSHPRWVVDELAAALVDRADELEALLRADNAAPRVTLVARPGLSEREELVAAGGAPTPYSPFGATLEGGDPGDVPAVAEGRAGVQDEGSQLMALALAEAPIEGTDLRWLDLCAGPGGKAALLAAFAAPRGGRLLAVERQPHRAELVRGAVHRLAGSAAVACADGTVAAWRPASFDRVLVDAPCTGLGALRRRPESRWRRTPDDLEQLVPLQVRLLSAALDAARPGGVVAYVTCSPVLAETRGVVETVLAGRPGVELLDATGVLAGAIAPVQPRGLPGIPDSSGPGVPDAGPLPGVPDAAGPLPGTVQLWPHRHGTDAMFLALLRTP